MKQVYFIIAMLCGLALGGQAQGIRLVSKWNSRFFRRKKWGSFTMSIL